MKQIQWNYILKWPRWFYFFFFIYINHYRPLLWGKYTFDAILYLKYIFIIYSAHYISSHNFSLNWFVFVFTASLYQSPPAFPAFPSLLIALEWTIWETDGGVLTLSFWYCIVLLMWNVITSLCTVLLYCDTDLCTVKYMHENTK